MDTAKGIADIGGILKVDGVINPADLMTKHLTAATSKTHTDTLGIAELSGRAEKAAQLR